MLLMLTRFVQKEMFNTAPEICQHLMENLIVGSWLLYANEIKS